MKGNKRSKQLDSKDIETTLVESVLSPELLEMLGQDANVVMIPTPNSSSSKQKRCNQEIILSKEEIAYAKKMSKRKRRKLESIQVRKDRDSKRDEYLETLQKHSISDVQQMLLTSTKLIGQTLTLKQKLKVVHRRHQAGLQLTDEEHKTLFPHGTSGPQHLVGDFDQNESEDDDALTKYEAIAVHTSLSNSVEKLVDEDVKPLANVVPATSSSSSWSGSNFHEQFQLLKSKLPSETVPPTNASVLRLLSENVHLINEVNNAHKQKYIPVEIVIPLDHTGSCITSSLKAAPSTVEQKLKCAVGTVIRSAEVQQSRMELPICKMEQEIVEAINGNDVVIVCGETGSGKSTQLPQFLYESGYAESGLIGITQPRRVAATSTAERVAFELGGTCHSYGRGGVVGYQIRYDASTVGTDTCIKFMTDGILLREITIDLLLRKYSVVILDEAHERGVNTDILLGLISRALPLRRKLAMEEMSRWNQLSPIEQTNFIPPLKPLKVIIMSATMRVEDFKSPTLFNPIPAVMTVEARQYPITTHFSRVTVIEDYLETAFNKICQIHKKLPAGGILVFLTGKKEIMDMCKRLSNALKCKKMRESKNEQEDVLVHAEDGLGGKEFNSFLNGLDGHEEADGDDGEYVDDDTDDDTDDVADCELGDNLFDDTFPTVDDISQKTKEKKDHEEEDPVSAAIADVREQMLRQAVGYPTHSASVEVAQVAASKGSLDDQQIAPSAALVLPLFAMLDTRLQHRIFQKIPEGSRLIVIATNVAETSITIPGIRYVVDCGRQKEKVLRGDTAVSSYDVRWISKASAEQRKGRAGRTGPGHVYRLYSSAFYDQHMTLYQEPEIMRTPLEDLLLQMRAMGINNLEDFPFPTRPQQQAINKAIAVLAYLGAVKLQSTSATLSWLYKPLDGAIIPKQRSCDAISSTKITSLGSLISSFPISPRYAKLLVTASKTSDKLLRYAILLVAVMSERSPFTLQVRGNDGDEDDDKRVKDSDLSRHRTSDVLARMRAAGAYFHARRVHQKEVGGEEKLTLFCCAHSLQREILDRVYDLMRQLVSLTKAHLKGAEALLDDGGIDQLAATTISDEIALRQVLLTGFCDSIARRAPPGVVAQGSRRKRLTAFLSCDPSISDPIYIHPDSCLYNSDPNISPPEYVVYSTLVRNQSDDTTYMTGLTEVSPQWIPELARDCPLLQWSAPLESPLPFYDPNEDALMCYVVPKYGILKWEIPPVKIAMKLLFNLRDGYMSLDEKGAVGYRDRDELARWFTRCLLEGQVFRELKNCLKKDCMKISPSTVTQMKLNQKVSAILQKVVGLQISCRRDFLLQLQQDPQFLTEEIQQFLHPEKRKSFREAFKLLADQLGAKELKGKGKEKEKRK